MVTTLLDRGPFFSFFFAFGVAVCGMFVVLLHLCGMFVYDCVFCGRSACFVVFVCIFVFVVVFVCCVFVRFGVYFCAILWTFIF